MTSETELREGLRRVADRLDAATGTTDVTAVVTRRPPASPRPSRAVLAVAAAIALVVGLVAVLSLDRTDDESVQIESPTTVAPPSSTSEPAGPPTSTEPEETPPSTSDVAPVPLSTYEGVALTDLPTRGLLVIEGGRALVFADDGTELGSFDETEVPGLGDDPGARLRLDVLLGTGVVVPAATPEPDGECASIGAAGVRAAVCGPERQLVVRLDAAGEARTLAEMPFGADVGRWRFAEPSPDGRWTLAAFAGECEVPTAILLPTDGSVGKTADGLTDVSAAATSHAVGWTSDGRAIVHFPPSECGSVDPEPGIHLIDPDDSSRTLLRAGDPDRVLRWEREENLNDRERAAYRAMAELGLRPCCGEPAHGGRGAATGVLWEGVEISIGGGDPGPLTLIADDGVLADVTAEEVDGLPVRTATVQGRPVLAFTCGATRWALSGPRIGDEIPADLDDLRQLAAMLIPRLYCTVGPPPTIEQDPP